MGVGSIDHVPPPLPYHDIVSVPGATGLGQGFRSATSSPAVNVIIAITTICHTCEVTTLIWATGPLRIWIDIVEGHC